MINGPLLRHTIRTNRLRVAALAIALGLWSFLMPVVYATFGRQMEVLLKSGVVPEAFLRLLGADPFSLTGAVALGAIHPVALGLQLVYPVGFAAAAIAGERQRGTLEVLLARPLSRRSVYATLLLGVVLAVVATTAAGLAGTVIGATAYGVADQLHVDRLLFLAANTVALMVAIGAVCLTASAAADRLAGPITIGLVVVILGYVLEVLGTLWPDAAFLQPLSPFHYLRPLVVLAGRDATTDLLVLVGLAVIAAAIGLVRFPRRDLAAPT